MSTDHDRRTDEANHVNAYQAINPLDDLKARVSALEATIGNLPRWLRDSRVKMPDQPICRQCETALVRSSAPGCVLYTCTQHLFTITERRS